MTATVETNEVVIADLSINDIRDRLASDYNVTLPKSWKRAQVVEVFTAALENRVDDYKAYIVQPLDTTGTTKNPATLTPDQLAERVKQHKENLEVDEAERLKKQAEKSKAKKPAYELSVDELVKRTNKIGYAIGVLGWALNRISKESNVVNTILQSLGDTFDADASELSLEALASGYAKSFDQFHQPSKACSSDLDGVDLRNRILEEIWTSVSNPTLSTEILESIGLTTQPVESTDSQDSPVEDSEEGGDETK